jgi:hypothetical protein
VNINDAKRCAGVQAALNLLVVRGPGVGIEGAAEVVVQKELPSDRDAEGVQAVVFDEVLHLVYTNLAGVNDVGGLARSVDGAAEVEAGDLMRSRWLVVFSGIRLWSAYIDTSIRDATRTRASSGTAASSPRSGCRRRTGRCGWTATTGQALAVVVVCLRAGISRDTARRTRPA